LSLYFMKLIWLVFAYDSGFRDSQLPYLQLQFGCKSWKELELELLAAILIVRHTLRSLTES
jgi:hypothetical protein